MLIFILLVNWCGGWDLNPRRAIPQGSEPCALNQAWLPPPIFLKDELKFRVFSFPLLAF